MNILCLYGSPMRKGNSAIMANAFLDAAKDHGASVKTFDQYSLKYSGCTACMACKTEVDLCIMKDDLSVVLDSIREVDVLVLAAPIYHGDVSAAMRAFVERTHSFLGPGCGPLPGESRLDPGKKLVFVVAQGYEEKKHKEVYPKYKNYFGWYGFDESYLLRTCEVIEPGEVREKCPDVLEEAKRLATEICGKGGSV